MTTKVTLQTHDWAVDVTTTDTYQRVLHTETQTVEPHQTRDFYITDTRTIQFTELPKNVDSK